jgi:hypothetical protein
MKLKFVMKLWMQLKEIKRSGIRLNFGQISNLNPNFSVVKLDETLSSSCSKHTVWNKG